MNPVNPHGYEPDLDHFIFHNLYYTLLDPSHRVVEYNTRRLDTRNRLAMDGLNRDSRGSRLQLIACRSLRFIAVSLSFSMS